MSDTPASRKDLARLGRKLDGRIRSQGRKLGSRIDSIETKLDRVIVETVKLKGDVSDIKETISTKVATKDDFRRMFSVVQSISDELQLTRQERTTLPHTLDRHGETLRDHSKRINALESRRP